MADRYDASGNIEGRFEPGSNNIVLANKLGISNEDEMADVELTKLFTAQEKIINDMSVGEQLTSQHICYWHELWLKDVYEWAGRYRTVNVSKDDFHFAVAHLLDGLMQKFEKEYLSKYKPSVTNSKDEIIDKLAVTHIEFILIHPFRDGNGRLGRLLMTIMALQAGLPILNFDILDKNREYYFKAIQAGHSGNYDPMKRMVSNVLEDSLI